MLISLQNDLNIPNSYSRPEIVHPTAKMDAGLSQLGTHRRLLRSKQRDHEIQGQRQSLDASVVVILIRLPSAG